MKKTTLHLTLLFVLFAASCRKSDTVAPTQTPTSMECGVGSHNPTAIAMEVIQKRRDASEPLNAINRPTITTQNKKSYAVLLLDFDGHTFENTDWNDSQRGASFYAPASGLTATQIATILDMVREDYHAFEIVVTTDSTLYNNASRKQRIVITRNMAGKFNVAGGYAFTNSIFWTQQTPALVFADWMSYITANIAEATSHELGHTVGLNHQSTYNATGQLLYVYNPGWFIYGLNCRPIMGTGYNGNVSGWMQGTSTSATTIQSDFGTLSYFGVKDDEIGDTHKAARWINSEHFTTKGNFTVKETVNHPTDMDVYKVHGNKMSLTIASGGNCDMKIVVCDGNLQEIIALDDPQSLDIGWKNVSTATSLFYVKVQAAKLGALQSVGQYVLRLQTN